MQVYIQMPVLMILPCLALAMDPSMVLTCAALLKKVNLLTVYLMLMSADVLMPMMLESPVLESVRKEYSHLLLSQTTDICFNYSDLPEW